MLAERKVDVRNLYLSGAYVFIEELLVGFGMPLPAERTLKIAGDDDPCFRGAVAGDATLVGGGDDRIIRSRLRCFGRGGADAPSGRGVVLAELQAAAKRAANSAAPKLTSAFGIG